MILCTFARLEVYVALSDVVFMKFCELHFFLNFPYRWLECFLCIRMPLQCYFIPISILFLLPKLCEFGEVLCTFECGCG